MLMIISSFSRSAKERSGVASFSKSRDGNSFVVDSIRDFCEFKSEIVLERKPISFSNYWKGGEKKKRKEISPSSFFPLSLLLGRKGSNQTIFDPLQFEGLFIKKDLVRRSFENDLVEGDLGGF